MALPVRCAWLTHLLPPFPSRPAKVAAKTRSALDYFAAKHQSAFAVIKAAYLKGPSSPADISKLDALVANTVSLLGMDGTVVKQLQAAVRQKAGSSAIGKTLRSVKGGSYPWVESWYGYKALYNGVSKQLSCGATGLVFTLSKTDVESAGISHCVVNAKGVLQRTLLGFDKDGNEINIKTGNVVEVATLAFATTKLQVPEGYTREDVAAVLERFRFEIVEAPGP